MPSTQLTLETAAADPPSDSIAREPDEAHDYQPHWAWPADLVEMVNAELDGDSLSVCPGTSPIADLNVDLRDLGSLADLDEVDTGYTVEPIAPESAPDWLLNKFQSADAAEAIYGKLSARDPRTEHLFDGYAATADAFALPFDDASFDVVVSDPPWVEMNSSAREALFREVIRVTKPSGLAIYNAPWDVESELSEQFDIRYRQDEDRGGNPSFLYFHRRHTPYIDELFEAFEFESANLRASTPHFWGEHFPPEAVSTDHTTDPRYPDPRYDSEQFSCPECGCSRLNQVRNDAFKVDGEYRLYECYDCQFRVDSANHR